MDSLLTLILVGVVVVGILVALVIIPLIELVSGRQIIDRTWRYKRQ